MMRPRVAATLALLVSAETAARAAPADEALRVLSARGPRTDYVVLLDTSAAMDRAFAPGLRLVERLAEQARWGDAVHLIAFNDRAGELLIAARAGAAAAALANVRQPHGPYTDLGAGFEAVLDTLLRPGAQPAALVFLISSFCHQPLPTSAFTGPPEDGAPCQTPTLTPALVEKARALERAEGRAVRVQLVGFDRRGQGGLAAARELFPGLAELDAGPAQGSALEELARRLPAERAAVQLAALLRGAALELTVPAPALPLQGPARLDLALASRTGIALRAVPREVRALDGSLRFTPPAEAPALHLPALPAGPEGAPAVARWEVRAENVPEQAEPWSPSRPAREVELELTLDVTPVPAQPFTALLGRDPSTVVRVRQRARLAFSPGAPARPLAVRLADGRTARGLAPGDAEELPLVLTSSVGWAEVEARCTVAGEAREPLQLSPGKGVPLAARLRNDAPPRRWRLATDETRSAALDLSCELHALPPDGARLPLGRQVLALSLSLSWREGVPRWLASSVIGAILLALFLYLFEVRPRLRPARLSGELIVYERGNDLRRLSFPLEGRARVELCGSDQAGGTPRAEGERVLLPGTDARAEVYAEKFGKHDVARLRRLQGGEVLLGESRVGAAPVDLRRGRSRFTIGNYHCRIE